MKQRNGLKQCDGMRGEREPIRIEQASVVERNENHPALEPPATGSMRPSHRRRT